MRNDDPIPLRALRLQALASPVRLRILQDLKRPRENYPPQVDGDPIADGICADFIKARLGLAPATVSRHLRVLTDAGFLIPTRKKGWTFFRRNDDEIARFFISLGQDL